MAAAPAPVALCRWCRAPRLLYAYGEPDEHGVRGLVLVCSTCDAPLDAILWARS